VKRETVRVVVYSDGSVSYAIPVTYSTSVSVASNSTVTATYTCVISLVESGGFIGVVVIVVGRINEVNQHRAPLVHDG